jgi:predicted acyltransferase
MQNADETKAMAKNEPKVRPAATALTSPSEGRISAIDALRGFDMFWIVGGKQFVLAAITFVVALIPASVGDTEKFLTAVNHQAEHVEWEGFTAWDLIMPLFLFVVGAAMPFSFARRLDAGESKSQLYWKILRRFVILFILGMAVQGHLLDFKLDTLHVFANTLQAIAVGYAIAGLLLLNTGIIAQVAFAVAMLVGYWLLLMYVPFGGHPAGTLEPNANLALAVDEFVLGRFRDGTTYTWVLSGMTFTATVLLGVFSGHVLRSNLSAWLKVVVLTGLGIICLCAGWAWAEWLGFPIIKHIWTSSMTLWSAGWCYLLLALFYLLIDVIGFRRWAFPFIVIGMNAITIYVAYWFVPFKGIAETLVGGLAQHLGSAGPLTISFTTMLLVWLVLYHLYRHRIFLRI